MRYTLPLLALLLALPSAAEVQPRGRRQAPAARRSARDVPAAAQLPDLEIKRIRPKAVHGQRVEVELSLYRPGRAMNQDVVVYWLQGSRKEALWRGKPPFSSASGGFKQTVTVNLAGKSLSQGRVLVAATACESLPRCKKELRLTGGDLRFEGSTSFESYGSRSELKLKLKNEGPGDFGACQVEVKVGRRVEKRWQLRGLRASGELDLAWSYGAEHRGKAFEARVACEDLISANNTRTGTLR
ncbi:hypothetical protein KKF91_07850 [Myxococcota bacterium]|nr:hypothetical protein [Myxococcota bacterium]MBU1430457.1 hypothetical protein [Myxococcota bacterium]MBU1898666.1 hypothetical protein [Myxococcota bacterium]